MDKTNWNSREYLWQPDPHTDNRIRIVPVPRKSTKATWWMRVNVHAVEIYRTKKFVCNEQLFKKPCRLCEMKRKFSDEGKHNEAGRIGLWKYTFLNVIDRAKEDEGVKVWMAPISAWWQIKETVFHDGDASLIIDSSEDGTYGCDLSVYYNPGEQFKRRYKVSILRGDPRPLGTEEQSKKWTEEVLPLKPENFFDPVEDEEVMSLESVIETEVFENWRENTKDSLWEKIYRPLGKRAIGCDLSDSLREKGEQLLEALKREEDIRKELPQWLEKCELEKPELKELDEMIDRVLEKDGFKADEDDRGHYSKARKELTESPEAYREWLEEHGGLEGLEMLVRIKSKGLHDGLDGKEKDWLLKRKYEYLMKYGVIVDRRSELHKQGEWSPKTLEQIKDDIKARLKPETYKEWRERYEKQEKAIDTLAQALEAKMTAGEDVLEILDRMDIGVRLVIASRLGMSRGPLMSEEEHEKYKAIQKGKTLAEFAKEWCERMKNDERQRMKERQKVLMDEYKQKHKKPRLLSKDEIDKLLELISHYSRRRRKSLKSHLQE